MQPTHRTPDGRLWTLLTLKGTVHAELWGAVGVKRLRTTDISNMEPIMLFLALELKALLTAQRNETSAAFQADKKNQRLEKAADNAADAMDGIEIVIRALESQ